MFTVKLISEVILQVPEQTYAIRVWENGKWNTLCTFPGTRDGYAQASTLIDYISNVDYPGSNNVKLEQLF